MKSFQKKQAFKLKELLKDQGIKISLQKVQDMLAKSYGYKNSHVFFKKEEEFNKAFEDLFKDKALKNKFISKKITKNSILNDEKIQRDLLKEYPYEVKQIPNPTDNVILDILKEGNRTKIESIKDKI